LNIFFVLPTVGRQFVLSQEDKTHHLAFPFVLSIFLQI